MLKKKKKKCPRCNNSIKKNFDFCPKCGFRLKEKDSYGGMIDEDFEEMPQFGGLIGGIMRSIPIKQLMNQISKQMGDFDKELEGQPKQKRTGISVSIKTVNGKPEIKVNPMGGVMIKKKPKEEEKKKIMSKEQEKRLEKLPRKEPASKVRRLSDSIIYEIDMPGVKEKDVFISRLKNSIEIKAIGKKEAFAKLIPISLPIKKYKVKDGKLILELKPEN